MILREFLPTWNLLSAINTWQALCGVASVIDIALDAQIGDFRRLPWARDLMAYFDWFPGGASLAAAPIWLYRELLARREISPNAVTEVSRELLIFHRYSTSIGELQPPAVAA